MRRLMLILTPLVWLAMTSGTQAQIILGQPVAIDGDTLDFGGTRVRLLGIDAPEVNQTCLRNGETWACGQQAKAALASLIDGQRVNCQQLDTDQYGRAVAICTAGRVDLADALATVGLAIALPQFSQNYIERADRARQLGVGIWAGEFQLPADFRASDPEFRQSEQRLEREQQRASNADRTRPPAQSNRSNVYYRGCWEARAAGAAPIHRGQPGYRPEMDGDGDGIACEPPRQ